MLYFSVSGSKDFHLHNSKYKLINLVPGDEFGPECPHFKLEWNVENEEKSS